MPTPAPILHLNIAYGVWSALHGKCRAGRAHACRPKTGRGERERRKIRELLSRMMDWAGVTWLWLERGAVYDITVGLVLKYFD